MREWNQQASDDNDDNDKHHEAIPENGSIAESSKRSISFESGGILPGTFRKDSISIPFERTHGAKVPVFQQPKPETEDDSTAISRSEEKSNTHQTDSDPSDDNSLGSINLLVLCN